MSELYSLSDLYQNKLFRIPDYQRGYAWRNEQLVDFWEDLLNLQTDRQHYTGMLSIKEMPASDISSLHEDRWLVEKGFKPYHVVDGQQRLTTFTILIHEILLFIQKLDENTGNSMQKIALRYETLQDIQQKYIAQQKPPNQMITSYLFGYEADNPSADYLKYRIFEHPYSGTISETFYTRNLSHAKAFFAERVEELFKQDGLAEVEEIYRKLTRQLMFNVHDIKDGYDVFVAFETMNNRGKKLTNLELLKNRLIYLTTLYEDHQLDQLDKTEMRRSINDAWKEVYYQLGRNPKFPLSDDEFLRAHWIMYFHYSRKKGNDYIQFLLNKFSAKSVFEKQVLVYREEGPQRMEDEIDAGEDGEIDADSEELDYISKLAPSDIHNYVNSLKEVAKYWYDTYFPEQSGLTDEEIIWLERLNRVGIGYFRPVVAVTLISSLNITPAERVAFFQAIERFIFLLFRMAGFQSSYNSSNYYRKARALYQEEVSISELTNNLNRTIDQDIKYAIKNFMNRIDKRFSNGDGYYGWRDLRYFLYEYEFEKARQTGIHKVGWKPFTQTAKDKVTIEHILPQTPTKWYWRNQFRHYTSEEIKVLSASLGNLLPLSQSVNSSLQNDNFEYKKASLRTGRRGYRDGSHSELEVAVNDDWDANAILKRGMRLLEFLERRWGIKFEDDQQKKQLLHLEFLDEPREKIPELPMDEEKNTADIITPSINESSSTAEFQLDFWSNFVNYCSSIGREQDIATKTARAVNYYDPKKFRKDAHLFFTVTYMRYLSIGIYIMNPETFKEFEAKKEIIEEVFGFEMDWYSSREDNKEKRVIYSIETDLYDPEKYQEHFDWFIQHYDRLVKALSEAELI